MSGALRGSEIDILWWNEIGVVSDNYCSSNGSKRPEESVNGFDVLYSVNGFDVLY